MSLNKLRLPAEWEPQSAALLTWPHAGGGWGETLASVELTFARIATAISRFEQVLVVGQDAAHCRDIQSLLATLPPDRLHLAVAESDDNWIRDNGPLAVTHNDTATLIDFQFNGWGNRHPATKDNQLSQQLFDSGIFAGTSLQSIDRVVEGGAIDSDGQGTVLATRRSLDAANKNPDLNLNALEQQLQRYLGINRILWIENGLMAGDDTGGHIDMLARFCDTRTIICVTCQDPDDVHYQPLLALHEELAHCRQMDGQPYQLIDLPLPTAQYNDAGQRLPASYANFLIINGAVLCPCYQVPEDAEALAILAQCFPGREIIGIDCTTLIHQGGSLHCASMQLPAMIEISK